MRQKKSENLKKVFCSISGACYTTVGGSETFTVSGSGESNGLQVVTVHEDANLFLSGITSEDILVISPYKNELNLKNECFLFVLSGN